MSAKSKGGRNVDHQASTQKFRRELESDLLERVRLASAAYRAAAKTSKELIGQAKKLAWDTPESAVFIEQAVRE